MGELVDTGDTLKSVAECRCTYSSNDIFASASRFKIVAATRS